MLIFSNSILLTIPFIPVPLYYRYTFVMAVSDRHLTCRAHNKERAMFRCQSHPEFMSVGLHSHPLTPVM
jgi:hypothetical protein